MTSSQALADFMDRELRVAEIGDSSNNGLQVENTGAVRKVCCGVDASMAFFEEARRRGADFLICHHGMSWGDSLKRIAGLNYRRIAFLVRHNMALYACHLPLDVHPRLGNNAQICLALGLRRLQRFGLHHGLELGFAGQLPRPMPYARFKDRVRTMVGGDLRTMDFGKTTVRTVAVVSGGAAGEIDEAGRKGIDVYLSGEPALSAYHLAQEYRINAVFAGHYRTEVFGVKAVGALLARKFKVHVEFADLGVPF